MSETLYTERELFEGMSPKQLTDYILEQSEKIGEAERHMNLASDVLRGYGTSIEEQLDLRQHETTNT